jgi:hypothetical protein
LTKLFHLTSLIPLITEHESVTVGPLLSITANASSPVHGHHRRSDVPVRLLLVVVVASGANLELDTG